MPVPPDHPRGGPVVADEPPSVTHLSEIPDDEPTRTAVALSLGAVSAALDPLAVTFFSTAADGGIRSTIAAETSLAPTRTVRMVRRWKHALHGVDALAPGRGVAAHQRLITLEDRGGLHAALAADRRLRIAHRSIGVANDARILLRREGLVHGGLTVWRSLRSPAWTGDQLQELHALQPFVELAYRSTAPAPAGGGDVLSERLSPRQREVALLLAAAATNAEIARSLHISTETAKAHTHAVLAKLRVASRRDVIGLVARWRQVDAYAPAAAGAGSALLRTRLTPDAPVTATGLLAHLLDWASGATGAVAGGMAVLSPRRDVVASAALADPRVERDDPLLAARLQAELLPPGQLDGFLARIVGDPSQPRVLPLDLAAFGGRHAGFAELLARGRLAPPMLLVLRVRGRVAALVWLAHDHRSDAAERQAAARLREMHPLLELAAASICAQGSAPSRHDDRVGDRPRLTPRQLEVARHAVAGASNAEIARRLGVTEAATKAHMTRILAKYGVRSRSQLMTLVARDPFDPCHG